MAMLADALFTKPSKVRRASFYRWCLSQGFRALMPMTLMTMGKYLEPDGWYFPSVLY
jgi:hypothetical protein